MIKPYLAEDELLLVREQLALQYPNLDAIEDYDTAFFYDEYKALDKTFKTRVDLPYQNLVNFSQTKNLSIHRWFYYQERFSLILIN